MRMIVHIVRQNTAQVIEPTKALQIPVVMFLGHDSRTRCDFPSETEHSKNATGNLEDSNGNVNVCL